MFLLNDMFLQSPLFAEIHDSRDEQNLKKSTFYLTPNAFQIRFLNPWHLQNEPQVANIAFFWIIQSIILKNELFIVNVSPLLTI